MKTEENKPKTIDEYIGGFPAEIQQILEQLRATIKEIVPEAEEAIKYQIPTFILKGNLVHFAAYNNHIGFYPAPSGITEFKAELSVYESGKGSVKFPIDKPLPLDLIRKIVQYRVMVNLEKARVKAKKSLVGKKQRTGNTRSN